MNRTLTIGLTLALIALVVVILVVSLGGDNTTQENEQENEEGSTTTVGESNLGTSDEVFSEIDGTLDLL